jgi:NitT/TauT family transport system permease protein
MLESIATWFFPFAVAAGAILFFCTRHSAVELSALSIRRMPLWERAILISAGIAFFIGVWSLAHWMKPTGITRIPSPLDTVRAAYELLMNGVLIEEAKVSFKRVIIGFTIASIIGVFGGLLAGSFSLVNRLTVPTNTFLRYIPPTAFVSVMIVYFGIGESYKYAVVFIGVVFFIFQMTVDVVEDLDVRYIEMGLTAGLTQLGVFRWVISPASWPRIVDVLRINLSGAWTFLVAAEIIGADTGLGHLIAISQRFLRIEQLYVAILMFGLIGIATDLVIQFVSDRLFKWHLLQVSR